MKKLATFLLITVLFIGQDLCGQCPERSWLRDQIAKLKISNTRTEDQLKELLPFVHQLETCPQPKDSIFAFLLQRIGALYYFKSDFQNAVAYTKRAIRIQNEKCVGTMATAVLSIKWYEFLHIFYDSLHQKKDMLEAIDSSISIAVRTDRVNYNVIRDLWEKVEYYYDLGEYERCVTNANLGETLNRKYSSGADSLQFVLNFSGPEFNALIALSKDDRVEELLKIKIKEFSKSNNKAALGAFLDQLSIVYTRKHQYTDALNSLRQSLACNEQIHFKLGCCQSLNNIGYFYLTQLQDYPKALTYCRKALGYLAEDNAQNSSEALEALNVYDNIANIYSLGGHPDSALFYFQKAFDQLQKGTNETQLLQSSLQELYEKKRIHYLIQLIIHKGDAFFSQWLATGKIESLSESIRIYKIGDLFLTRIKNEQIEMQSQLAFRRNARNLYEHAIRAASLERDREDVFYFFERSRAILLNDQLNQQASLDNKAIFDQARIKKRVLRLEQEMEGMPPDSQTYATLQNQLFSAKQELEIYKQPLREHNSLINQLKPDSIFIRMSNLQTHLRTNHASFLEIYAGDSSVYSLLITDQNANVQKINKSDYDSTANLYLSYLADPSKLNRDMPGYIRTAYHLICLLFPNGISPSGRLIVSPDGRYFPFESLVLHPSRQDPEYFLIDHPICYTYSAHYLLHSFGEEIPSPGKDFMGIAPVKYAAYLHLPELTGSRTSLDQIGSYFERSDEFTSFQASKNNFLENFSRYQLIQLYTHATGNSPDKEPIIYFADSALSLSELIPENRPATRLVVLSACETANGQFYQGEGVFSFNREFAALGIPASIANLWSVDNTATYRLTELFYKYLARGDSTDIALQKAKKEFLQKSSGEQRLPYYWAAPVLIGKTTVLAETSPHKARFLFLLFIPMAILVYLTNRFQDRRKNKSL